MKTKDGLLDPTGRLSETVPSTSIEEANKEVSAELALVDNDSGKKWRGAYMIATLEQKAKDGKYAAENGKMKAICHFAKDMPGLKENIQWEGGRPLIYVNWPSRLKQVKKIYR